MLDGGMGFVLLINVEVLVVLLGGEDDDLVFVCLYVCDFSKMHISSARVIRWWPRG
jgi:hypothetical protein